MNVDKVKLPPDLEFPAKSAKLTVQSVYVPSASVQALLDHLGENATVTWTSVESAPESERSTDGLFGRRHPPRDPP